MVSDARHGGMDNRLIKEIKGMVKNSIMGAGKGTELSSEAVLLVL